MITSFTRGRIRLRLEHLKGAETPELPKEALKGVRSLAVNPRTGGALLEYDPDVIDVGTIASVIEPFDPHAAETLRHPHLLKARTWFGAPHPTLEQCPAPPEPQPGQAPPRKRLRGSAEATSEMLELGAAFIGTVISGFFSSRRLHVQMGVLTGLVLLGHVWKHRKRLRPLHQMTILEILGIPKIGALRRGLPPAGARDGVHGAEHAHAHEHGGVVHFHPHVHGAEADHGHDHGAEHSHEHGGAIHSHPHVHGPGTEADHGHGHDHEPEPGSGRPAG